jgi:KDO2-lipid IV(A) lauroyltransferase
MGIQKFINSQFGVGLGLALGRATPPGLGYRFSKWFARQLAQRESSPMVQAVRKNQWVVRGGNMSPQALNAAVEEVFTHAGRCFIDLYHNLKNPDGIKTLVLDSPQERELIQHSKDQTCGSFIVAPHMSNFDICLLALAYRGLHAQVLSYGQPTGGYEIQNDLRAQTGLDITPISPEVHWQAIENMRNGGLVITAVDRPIRRKAHYLNFFGRPSPLPAGHIRMAIEAGVPIIVVSASMDPAGNYHIHFSDPIPMQSHQDSEKEIKINGEAVLRVIEDRILANPGQWLMYYPVWPDLNINGD